MHRNWTPAIMPGGHDKTVYLAADDCGRIGRELFDPFCLGIKVRLARVKDLAGEMGAGERREHTYSVSEPSSAQVTSVACFEQASQCGFVAAMCSTKSVFRNSSATSIFQSCPGFSVPSRL
jgi:hypothetical protein